jgi:anthranilate synthase component II
MKILVLDNYDSFTYNLVHIVRALGHAMDIYRNDKITIDEVKKYDKILLSPGPGIPDEAGIMKEVIYEYGQTKSILGASVRSLVHP